MFSVSNDEEFHYDWFLNRNKEEIIRTLNEFNTDKYSDLYPLSLKEILSEISKDHYYRHYIGQITCTIVKFKYAGSEINYQSVEMIDLTREKIEQCLMLI